MSNIHCQHSPTPCCAASSLMHALNVVADVAAGLLCLLSLEAPTSVELSTTMIAATSTLSVAPYRQMSIRLRESWSNMSPVM